jgi:ParB family chromosome partitioning protein
MIRTLDRDAAAIALVDSNLHREHILPSEKAFAYKMKYDAMRHQGTSSQLGTKLRADEEIAMKTNESRNQVQRYIRLTHLSRSLLNLVDEGQIALTPAVELSFLTESEQADLAEAIAYAGATPSLSQAQQMKRLSQEGRLTAKEIERILSEPKPNQREQLRLRRDELKRFFPANCSDEQMKRDILRGLELLHRQRSRGQER